MAKPGPLTTRRYSDEFKGTAVRLSQLPGVKVSEVAEISIDGKGRLLVKPRTQRFPFIYREAMEVHWDGGANYLYAPQPREWSYVQWFKQILAAAHEQSCDLYISERTAWSGIPEALKQEILQCAETPDA